MNSPTINEADENYRMIAVKVYQDHRMMGDSGVYKEFRIDCNLYSNVLLALDELSKREVNNDTTEDEAGDPIYSCEAGFEDCDHDDYESMSDDCKQSRAEDIGEARNDTHD